MWRKERERFYHGKRQHPLRNFCLSLLLFVCICSAFFSGFERLSDTTRRRQKESLDDLTENCGIQYDKKQFFIDYQIAGANILPDITVIER